MRKSQKNNSALSRFVYYKYSGLIVFVPIAIIAITGYVYMTSQYEFFSPWSCETISDYLMDIDVPDRFPTHAEITEDQHLKLHRIVDECNAAAKFSDKIRHP